MNQKTKIAIVLPAYNAALTLEATVLSIPKETQAQIILVDDASKDDTVQIAEKLGLQTISHANNRGYGANQ